MAHLVPHHDDSASSSAAACSASVPYASSSTASCSASVPYVHYDIFINLCEYDCFRRDVNIFAAKLCSAFEYLRLHVFLDKPNWRELRDKIPPAIENAILASPVHIPILTPNFAQSKCFLDDLVLMIKSSAESKTTILPVFYYAKPSEFKRTGEGNNGPYAQALCNYEKENRYDTETIKKWRAALHHVAEVSGFVVDENHRDEEEIMYKVIESVFQDFPYGPRYDVFLNHRGPDVKKTFARPLYDRLVSCGYRGFLDEQEFMRGLEITPQIAVAIQFAHVNIAIFSPGYAESRWCLDELNLMVRSRKTILPVFYEVKLSDLRYPEGGLYAEALLKQKDRSDAQTFQDWRDALSEVGKLPRHELDGDKDKLLDKIVETVKENIAKRFEVIRSSDLQNALKSVLKERDVKPAHRITTGMIQDVREAVRQTSPVRLQNDLLESCISAILSFTTPRDVCRLAAVSRVFRAAAYSDAVWNTFLPPQCDEILPRAVTPLQFASCRELYFRLCDSILIDAGRKLFWLERSTATIGYMLSARALSIDCADDDRYCRWVCRDDSRFDELAELSEAGWSNVGGTIDCRLLSAATWYRVVFVLKLNAESDGFDKVPIRFSVNTLEELILGQWQRDGGWMKVFAGHFVVTEEGLPWEFAVTAEGDLDDRSSHIRFDMSERQRLHWKTGLLVDGVKIEPIGFAWAA